ncbi:MAG: 4-alpha-glucanotransferase [Treponema sp.]|jgi:4-alpha-glucanotransferase|nr:4-alpha-glucanotransferase [Treponema sp.]
MEKLATNKRLIGVAVPVGALRTKNGMGVGEFSDLGDFALLCKRMKIGLIQILPVNDTGFDSSPYFSLTAFALHPIYLRIDELDEFEAASSTLKRRVKTARNKFDKDVRYSHYKILKEKLEILREIFSENKAAIKKSAKKGSSGILAAWIEKNAWVKQYAVYRRLKELNDLKSWKEWKEHRIVTRKEIEGFWNDEKLSEEHLFWVWLQYALDNQFSNAVKKIREAGIVLKGDIPILMNEDSCDVWAYPELYNQSLSAGAPPDMFNPDGQNWGFPIYNWEAHEQDDFAWWKNRLAVASKYYEAYRIDHVLGFFHIWASTYNDYSSALGRFIPYIPVAARDLKKLGFDKDRIRWVSQSHLLTGEVWDALKNNWGSQYTEEEIKAAADDVFSKALNRIKNEDIWLFNKNIKGEKDIDALGLHPAVRNYLFAKWRDRVFLEYEKGLFTPTWLYKTTSAYKSFSEEEKKAIEELLAKHEKKSEKVWETLARKLLTVLAESSPMLPCAEDLGAVPNCLPKVLSKLKILSLKLMRWYTDPDKEGEPYVPFEDYPPLSVCTPAVHDSSTLRQWWEKEADQKKYANLLGVPSLPKVFNPGTAKIILSKAASARSRFRIFQIQDIMHLSSNWYSENPVDERINVPGTLNDFNWTYRLPTTIAKIARDKELIKSVRELSRIKPAKKIKKLNDNLEE